MGEDVRSEPVKVFCRIRPSGGNAERCITVIDDCSLSVQNRRHPGTKSVHTFSNIFQPEATQTEVYATCVSPYVNAVLNGENALIFAYGVTGSGKTHTMQGSVEDPGIIPRTLDTFFNSISTYSTLKYVVKPDGYNGFGIQSEAEAIMDRQRLEYTSKPRTINKINDNITDLKGRYVDPTTFTVSQQCLYTVFVSFAELYNDNIYDLLDPNITVVGNLPRILNMCEDAKRNTYINGITELEVKSANEALKAYYQGQRRRRVGATVLNKDSSRSHAIFTIRIVRSGYDSNYDEVIPDVSLVTVNQLCLVDLAGSERTNRSGTTGGRLKEAAKINNSLMTLRKCVDVLRSNQNAQLVGGQSVQQIVPYRDSKLTRLFKSFFDGHGQVGILICIDPATEECAETVQVLQFAERSQQISMNVPSNPIPMSNTTNPSRVSRGSTSALINTIEELVSTSTRFDDADTTLKANVSRIAKSDLGIVSYCGCSADNICLSNSGSKRSKRSSVVAKRKHDENCLFLSALRTRDHERKRLRSAVELMLIALENGVTTLVKRAEDGAATSNLIDTIESLKTEKIRTESKLRNLENEMTKQRTLVRHERAERTREAELARAQLKKLRTQVDSQTGDAFATPRVPRNLRRRSRGGAQKTSTDSSASYGGIDDKAKSKEACNKAPASASRVAVLSRQWELLAAKQQQDDIIRSRLRMPPQTPLCASTNDLSRPPAMNPRHQHFVGSSANARGGHRRSKSVGGDVAVWLEHKENHPVPLGTIFSPTGANIRKSATKIDLNDTLKATNYVLHHQTATSDGNVETQLFKGSIIPTAGGGSAVIFNDVEHLRQTSPLKTELRRSTRLSAKHPLPADDNGEDATSPSPTAPPATKRRASSSHRRGSSTSGFSSADPFGTANETDERDAVSVAMDRRGSMASYRTISPPRDYIGISNSGGISGGGGRGKRRNY